MDVYYYFLFQIVWGVFLSLAFIFGVVNYLSYSSLHYNTVALPITLALMILMGTTIHPRIETGNKMIVIPMYIILIAGILSLHGRRPFLGVLAAIIFSLLIYHKKILYLARELSAQLIITIIVSVFILGQISIHIGSNLLIERLTRLISNPTQEPRIQIYITAIDIIKNHPSGIGLGTFSQITEYPYPHNLFLHAFTSGGIIAGIIFLTVIFSLLWKSFYCAISDNTGITFCLFLCIIYLLLVFSTSYSISDTYGLFALLGAGASIADTHSR